MDTPQNSPDKDEKDQSPPNSPTGCSPSDLEVLKQILDHAEEEITSLKKEIQKLHQEQEDSYNEVMMYQFQYAMTLQTGSLSGLYERVLVEITRRLMCSNKIELLQKRIEALNAKIAQQAQYINFENDLLFRMVRRINALEAALAAAQADQKQ